MAQLPDSGDRREFTTGSVRDKVDGKGAFHLLSPFALRAYAKRMEDGMSKYGERNWEKGQPVMTYLDSGLRHVNDYVADCMVGDEPKEDHLGAALWNIAAAIHTLAMLERGMLPAELDNRPGPPRICTGTLDASRITPGEITQEQLRSAIKGYGNHMVCPRVNEEPVPFVAPRVEEPPPWKTMYASAVIPAKDEKEMTHARDAERYLDTSPEELAFKEQTKRCVPRFPKAEDEKF